MLVRLSFGTVLTETHYPDLFLKLSGSLCDCLAF